MRRQRQGEQANLWLAADADLAAIAAALTLVQSQALNGQPMPPHPFHVVAVLPPEPPHAVQVLFRSSRVFLSRLSGWGRCARVRAYLLGRVTLPLAVAAGLVGWHARQGGERPGLANAALGLAVVAAVALVAIIIGDAVAN